MWLGLWVVLKERGTGYWQPGTGLSGISPKQQEKVFVKTAVIINTSKTSRIFYVLTGIHAEGVFVLCNE